METIINPIWMEKLNKLSAKVLMPVMAVLFICTNTVFNLWIGERAETIQNILAIFILLIVASNLLVSPKNRLLPWVMANKILIIYFVARGISLVLSGFDYSVIRTIFFEAFFLIGICNFTIDGGKNFYIKFFIWFELISTAVSLVTYYLSVGTTEAFYTFFMEKTYYTKCGNAWFFSNPNTAGLMAGFSIVLAIILFGKKNYNKWFIGIFGVYNVVALFLFGCRSADMGVIAVIVAVAVSKLMPKIKKNKIAIVSLILMVATLVPLYGMLYNGEKKNGLELGAFETQIDSLSTGRYMIWRECFTVQKDALLLGDGNLKLEQEARKDFAATLDQNYYWRYGAAAGLGPHNGYIGMISGTGLVGLALFIAILLQRIKRAKHLEKGNWYLILVFSFAINCFESLFILNRFFTCFYMFLILETDMDDDITKLDHKEVTQ